LRRITRSAGHTNDITMSPCSHCLSCRLSNFISDFAVNSADTRITGFLETRRHPQADQIATQRCLHCPLRAPGRNAPLIRFLILALYRAYTYCLLVYIVCFPTDPFYLHFFLIYLPLSNFSFENRPAPFPGRVS